MDTSTRLLPPETDETEPEGPRRTFVLTWCDDAPERVGETAILLRGRAVLGRGGPRRQDPAPRLRFSRPDRSEGPTWLTALRMSRVQAELRCSPSGEVAVEALGRAPLHVNGRPVQEARLRDGDVLSVPGAVSVLFRYREPPPRFDGHPALRPAFGRADGCGFVGESPAAWALRARLAFAARHAEHTLVQGPSGTGKELAARALHQLAGSEGPLVARNAATIPDGLADAELFGNARGYPNPGTSPRKGLVGEADGGVLFLDEIGELAEPSQARLLRVLDEGEYQRLGEDRRRSSRFRMVAATNRPASALKHDVLARFALRVHTPGLDERPEDIPLLARHLLRSMDTGHDRLSQDLSDALLRARWPDNIRGLRSVLWEAVAGSPLPCAGLTADVRRRLDERSPAEDDAPATTPIDRATLEAALAEHEGVKARVWKALGLRNRWALDRLLKKHGLESEGE